MHLASAHDEGEEHTERVQLVEADIVVALARYHGSSCDCFILNILMYETVPHVNECIVTQVLRYKVGSAIRPNKSL